MPHLDDALRCQYEIALPVLERHGLTAFWFVYSAVFEGHRPPLEIYRWFRTTQYRDMESFYMAFEKRAHEAGHGTRLVSGLHRFDPERYLAQYTYFTSGDRRFRFIRDEILSPMEYEQIMDSMIAAQDICLDRLGSLLWMDDACLVDLHRKGHVIGLHSYSHPTALARLPVSEQSIEYARNADHLARVLGSPPRTVSHPSNSYGKATLEILRAMGVDLGFRADMERKPNAQLELPRQDHAHVLADMHRT